MPTDPFIIAPPEAGLAPAAPTADALPAGGKPLSTPAAIGAPAAGPAQSAATHLGAVDVLLEGLEAPPQQPESLLDSAELRLENQLVQVRLGVASSLFAALRAKHAPTAHHSLRVALGCSAWGAMLGLRETERDELEVAALLHDIGKIGVPDDILLKPARLSPDQYLVVERHRQIGVEILRSCAASREILRIVQFAGAWFDGSREGYDLRSEQLPLGARMVAIFDAFDAMTSDHAYRRAMSRERALAELFEFAGTQFDPRLVQDFCGYISADQMKLQSVVARRWLKQLGPESGANLWQLQTPQLHTGSSSLEGMFHRKLLESMQDAVVFVDSSQRIVLWNRAAERLTGIAAASVEHKHWSSSLVGLRDERNQLIADPDCPVVLAIRTGVTSLRRLSVTGRNGQQVEVDAQLMPVYGKNGVALGAALLMHDASSQVTLEQRVQSLHERATRDALTQVANRAEFDRLLQSSVESHLERRLPCSLIISDLDHFKRINDTYGHQAGDEVLVGFGALLRRHCRSGDLVARYGGEEFVMLCPDCDNATATRRAEEIRLELAELPMMAIGGKSVTSSFGVTELQSGDTPETMLRRADRALYQAKESGRNMVVQLGSGIDSDAPAAKPRGFWAWLRGGSAPEQVLKRSLATSVPFNVVVEKMRGFVADHHAQIDSLTETSLVLKIDGTGGGLMRRTSDRNVPFLIEMRFDEAHQVSARGKGKVVRTIVQVTIRPQRARDRRHRDVLERATRLMSSLKSYLVAQDHQPSDSDDQIQSQISIDSHRLKAAADRWAGV
jgi:diguanylate cyclase (GGDEF)-like protein/PAS domain S-box-containing protein/putative nucleotidyltransferase with HDIG domain